MADLPIQTWAVPVELTERTVAIVHARTPEEAQELVIKGAWADVAPRGVRVSCVIVGAPERQR